MRFFAAVIILLIATPATVLADARQFIPKIVGYSGTLEMDSTYDSDENSTGNSKAKTSDLFIKEILDLSANGYVYHPRFISFALRLAGGLKEENFSSGAVSKFSTMSAKEYEIRAMVLPEHPYNLELFRLRLEPIAKGVFSPQSQSVAYSSGAIFRYKKKPYFLNVHYLDNTNESSYANYSTTKYGFLGTYYKELSNGKRYSFSASYDHQISGSSDITSSSDDAALGNVIASKIFNISSDVSYHSSGQNSAVEGISFSGKNVQWIERGHVSLPWNFSAELSYGLSKDSMTVAEPSSGETTMSNTTNEGSVSITHQLYESLVSTYSLGYNSMKSDAGDSTTFSNNIGFSYSKKIPGGRLRSAFSFGTSKTDSTGFRSIASESHSAVQIPGHFNLNFDNVNPSTIIVWMKSPDVQGELILLVENINYVITPFGNTFEIDILNLPTRYTVPGTYDFVVSYSLNEQDSQVETRTLNYSLRLELFRDMLVPYYSHLETRERLVGGFVDNPLLDMKTDLFGLLFSRRPFTFTAEYQVIDSNVNPSRGWKAELNYQNNVLVNTEVQATLRYSSTYYPEGTSGTGESYTDKLLGASAGLQQRIPKKNMFLYLGGAYTNEQGFGSSTTYSLNSSFVWTLGKLFITAGANASLADAEIRNISTRRTTQNYYLTIKRKLF